MGWNMFLTLSKGQGGQTPCSAIMIATYWTNTTSKVRTHLGDSSVVGCVEGLAAGALPCGSTYLLVPTKAGLDVKCSAYSFGPKMRITGLHACDMGCCW